MGNAWNEGGALLSPFLRRTPPLPRREGRGLAMDGEEGGAGFTACIRPFKKLRLEPLLE